MKKIIVAGLLSIVASATAAEVNLELLKASLNPTAQVKSAKPTPIPGLFEVQINNDIIYLTEDGTKVISGDIYDLVSKTSYTDVAKKTLTEKALSSVKDEDKIIYKAEDEKYKVMVFTDITCPYCSKLHQHMQAYNDAGITVEYLAFPRAGIGSTVQKNMQKIWCASDKASALTDAKTNHKIPDADCQGAQVTEQFLLGRDIGINATPTLIFSDGEIRPGYLSPADLLNILQQRS